MYIRETDHAPSGSHVFQQIKFGATIVGYLVTISAKLFLSFDDWFQRFFKAFFNCHKPCPLTAMFFMIDQISFSYLVKGHSGNILSSSFNPLCSGNP